MKTTELYAEQVLIGVIVCTMEYFAAGPVILSAVFGTYITGQ